MGFGYLLDVLTMNSLILLVFCFFEARISRLRFYKDN